MVNMVTIWLILQDTPPRTLRVLLFARHCSTNTSLFTIGLHGQPAVGVQEESCKKIKQLGDQSPALPVTMLGFI
jgi:hypothetical protein